MAENRRSSDRELDEEVVERIFAEESVQQLLKLQVGQFKEYVESLLWLYFLAIDERMDLHDLLTAKRNNEYKGLDAMKLVKRKPEHEIAQAKHKQLTFQLNLTRPRRNNIKFRLKLGRGQILYRRVSACTSGVTSSTEVTSAPEVEIESTSSTQVKLEPLNMEVAATDQVKLGNIRRVDELSDFMDAVAEVVLGLIRESKEVAKLSHEEPRVMRTQLLDKYLADTIFSRQDIPIAKEEVQKMKTVLENTETTAKEEVGRLLRLYRSPTAQGTVGQITYEPDVEEVDSTAPIGEVEK